jgi:hypothetical protein
MNKGPRKSFSSGPPKFLVCRLGSPTFAAATFAAAVELAGKLAVDHPDWSITIYEIATGAHHDFAAGATTGTEEK